MSTVLLKKEDITMDITAPTILLTLVWVSLSVHIHSAGDWLNIIFGVMKLVNFGTRAIAHDRGVLNLDNFGFCWS